MTLRMNRKNVNSPAAVVVALMAVVAVSAGAGVAQAHVALDSPNGGEVLDAGSTFPIVWHDQVQHGPADYDLWYSTTGPSGPWIDIASNLTPPQIAGGYTYEWAVPNTPSTQVRVRVQQDNDDEDYLDMSDSELSIVTSATTGSIVLEPVADATIYEESGTTANGAGSFLFTGRTETRNGSVERRALLTFDIAGSVPPGSTILSVDLDLTMSKTTSGAQSVGLLRTLESWTEGPSDAPGQEGGGTAALAGDVTWEHRVYPDTMWSTSGGVFSSSMSATQQIASPGSYTFQSTAQMVADVQAWLDDPASNHGWALVMDPTPTGSAKRFNSRENSSASSRPHLTITYEESETVAPTADFTFSPASPMVGDPVSFTDLSTGSPTSWTWDFGDGTIANDQNPEHTYENSGAYTVGLTVSNDAGVDTTSMVVTVIEDAGAELTELVFVPAAANAAGSGDSFFVTTLDVHNPGPAPAAYRLLWLPRNNDNSEPAQSELFTIGPGESQRYDNLLADTFGLSNAVGAVAILSDTSDMEAMSRTFNQSGDGTFGQSLPGVPSDELIAAGQRVRILFLTEDDAFRSNLGFANGVDTAITVEWELFAPDGSSLRTGMTELPPWGNKQLNRVLGDYAPIDAAYADVWTTTTGGAFTCYGSVLDETTSDPTTILPR